MHLVIFQFLCGEMRPGAFIGGDTRIVDLAEAHTAAFGDWAQAEADYHRAMTWSRARHEKWGELNAALRLARLRQADGHADRARELLAPVYGWFTEGFDNPVLRDAKALLDELTGTFDSAAIADRCADPGKS